MPEPGTEEKTESPSQKKRDDARQEGQVAFSREVTSAALLGGFLLLMYFSGDLMLKAYEDALRFSFDNLYLAELSIPMIKNLFQIFIRSASIIIIPFFGTAIFVGILSSVAQVGINLTLKPLQPKIEKLSPLKGIKRLFSKQALSDLFKSLFKMSVILYIGYYTFVENLEEITALSHTNHQTLLIHSSSIIGLFVFRLFLAL
ncbi:MAG: EscU/YscU/HrcU family type III secretion system export apparatus switch protein, partial [Deltaproteobacteria bacterium]|nr:EscU/YscU/HrcU family type III secretion system export apparatus switch protein [Deltaproteobacteria bacterium]